MRNLEKIFASAMIIAGTMGGNIIVDKFNIRQPKEKLELCLSANNQSMEACTQESEVARIDEVRALGLFLVVDILGLLALANVAKEKA